MNLLRRSEMWYYRITGILGILFACVHFKDDELFLLSMLIVLISTGLGDIIKKLTKE